tara:strand:+ start:754 stop:1833 length:1080 start_codon:yes stop_codon:yes gene_type:complete
MKTFLFCSLYYNKEVTTGANKRFENFILHFEDILSEDEKIIVIVKKNNIPDYLACLKKITFIEVPQFIVLDRILSFIYLTIKFYSLNPMVVVSDFMPIPNRSLSNHIHYQLIHDIRNFTEYRRSSFFSTADLIQKKQWRQSNKIMTVSNFTRDELISNCQIDVNDIFVSYNGIDDRYIKPRTDVERDIDISYIATFEKRKNHRLLVKALSNYSGDKEIRVLLIGKDLGLLNTIIEESKGLKNIDLSVVDSITNEEEIISIYDRSKLFVYPSLYEGFGMPLVEAISRGCKILCSDIDVFREIGGDIPKYFSPDIAPSNLMSLIENELSSDKYPSNLTDEYLNKFKWREIAKKFYLHVKNQ